MKLCFEKRFSNKGVLVLTAKVMVESVLLQIHDVVVLLSVVVVWLLVTAQLRPTDQAVAVASGSAV